MLTCCQIYILLFLNVNLLLSSKSAKLCTRTAFNAVSEDLSTNWIGRTVDVRLSHIVNGVVSTLCIGIVCFSAPSTLNRHGSTILGFKDKGTDWIKSNQWSHSVGCVHSTGAIWELRVHCVKFARHMCRCARVLFAGTVFRNSWSVKWLCLKNLQAVVLRELCECDAGKAGSWICNGQVGLAHRGCLNHSPLAALSESLGSLNSHRSYGTDMVMYYYLVTKL
jgi:hypothetical protein